MFQEHQDCQLHSSSNYHEKTYILSRQEFAKSIKTVSLIPAPATMRKLTLCQGKNAPRALRLWASFQLQPAWENLQPVKLRMPQEHQDCQLQSSSSHCERTYSLLRQECPKSIKTVSCISTPATMSKPTNCQGKNAPRASKLSAAFQLQPPWINLPTVKARMPQENQDCEPHSSSSHHESTYSLSSQESPKRIKIVSFIPAPTTMIRKPTAIGYQAKNATRASRLLASIQLQPSWENLQPVKSRMPQEHQDCQLHSSSSHHERTYILSRQECPKCQLHSSSSHCKRTYRLLSQECPKASRLSASFQLQPPWHNLQPVKARMPQENQDCEPHYSSSHHERTYTLPRQECHKSIKTVSFIPAPTTMRKLTATGC